MALLLISFIAGLLTVLAPCVLPLLPVIVGGSVSGGASKRKALVISISLGVSIILFTLLLKVSSALIEIPPFVWTLISGGIVLIFGLITLFPTLWDRIPAIAALNRKSNIALGAGYQKHSLWGDVIIGASLGPVFSSCSPTYFLVLATVLPQSFTLGLIDLLAYSIGLSGALFALSILGQKIIDKLGWTLNPHGWFKRVLGILFVIVGIAILTGVEKKAEVKLLSSGFFDITRIEQGLLKKNKPMNDAPFATTSEALIEAKEQMDERVATSTTSKKVVEKSPTELEAARLKQKARTYEKAPELVDVAGYINTGGLPIKISDYRGKKVVLIDVWTYSCINCQRTLPYVKSWYEKYEDDGFVIIGVHTPEFGFEKVQKNVEKAVADFGIKYPVILDNNYGTWNAFSNQYWPRKYLIDVDGFIVYDHAGEGNYDETEAAIVKALKERADILKTGQAVTKENTTVDAVAPQAGTVRSPEMYFGAGRNEYLGNGTQFSLGLQTLSLPVESAANALYLSGPWSFEKEYAETKGETHIRLTYYSTNVYFVAEAKAGATITVKNDGKIVSDDRGKDVNTQGTLFLYTSKLYHLIQNREAGAHTLEIILPAGVDAYTFTFG